MKKRYLGIVCLFMLHLAACSNREIPSENEKAVSTNIVNTESFSFHVTGESVTNWDEARLSKEEFQTFLQSLTVIEDGEQYFVTAELIADHTIQLVLNNEEEQSIDNLFLVQLIDNAVRQLYMRSDYGDSQPTIIFKNLRGDIVAENDDFLSTEANEASGEVRIGTMD